MTTQTIPIIQTTSEKQRQKQEKHEYKIMKLNENENEKNEEKKKLIAELEKIKNPIKNMKRALSIIKNKNAVKFVSLFISSHGSIVCDDNNPDMMDIPDDFNLWYIPTISKIGIVNYTIAYSVDENYVAFMEFIKSIDQTLNEDIIAIEFLKMRYSFIVGVFTHLLSSTLTENINKLKKLQQGQNPRASSKETMRDIFGWLLALMGDPDTFQLYVYKGKRSDNPITVSDQIVNKTFTSDITVKDEATNWKILMNLSSNKIPTNLQAVSGGIEAFQELTNNNKKFQVKYSGHTSIDILPIIAAIERTKNKNPGYPTPLNPGRNEINLLQILQYVKSYSNFCILHDVSCFTAINKESGLEIVINPQLSEINIRNKALINNFMVDTGIATAAANADDAGRTIDAAVNAANADAAAAAAAATTTYINQLLQLINSNRIDATILAHIKPKELQKYNALIALVTQSIQTGSLAPFYAGGKPKPKSKKTKSKKFQRRSKRRNNRRTYKKKARKTKRRRRY